MRIIKEINKGLLKVTIFKYQEKISIKFEKELNEMLIKFRDGGLDENEIDKFLTASAIEKYEALLDAIDETKISQLIKMEEEKGFEFPEIL